MRIRYTQRLPDVHAWRALARGAGTAAVMAAALGAAACRNDAPRAQLATTPPAAPAGPALPASPASTIVERMYPSGPTVPANVQRLYLEFSGPMSAGGALDHVRLLDAGGRDLPGAFHPIEAGLWDPEMRRLTLVLARVRAEDDGGPSAPALTAGRRYTLVVDADWHDALGRPLAQRFEHSFRVTAGADRPLDPSRWRLAAPAAGTRDPIVVLLPRALDYGLLRRAVGVRDPHGAALNGVITIDRDERRWQFTPTRPWEAGPHAVVADHVLEDPAGNRIPPDEHPLGPDGVPLEHVAGTVAIR
jgi:hypothetical protein